MEDPLINGVNSINVFKSLPISVGRLFFEMIKTVRRDV
ncbi:hypothetical protein K710_0485 [Streptococcus iniae SF1]|nr:hypothetical protein K710_0485 [Streptococcus iniae SF1]